MPTPEEQRTPRRGPLARIRAGVEHTLAYPGIDPGERPQTPNLFAARCSCLFLALGFLPMAFTPGRPWPLRCLILAGGLAAAICFAGALRIRDREKVYCRRCRYECGHITPDHPTCPECGTTLLSPRARVRGRLHASRPLILAAFLCLLPTIALALLALQGARIVPHLSTPHLIHAYEAGWFGRSRDVETELLSRTLTPEEHGALFDAYMSLHGTDRTFNSPVADWGAQQALAGNVTGETLHAWYEGLLELGLRAPESITRGDDWPVEFITTRYTNVSPPHATVWFTTITHNGATSPLPWEPIAGIHFYARFQQGVLTRFPDLTPGRHEFTFRGVITITPDFPPRTKAPDGSYPLPDAPLHQRPFELTTSVTVQ